MIRECVVDSTLNRLSSAFGNRLIIRPPASAEDLAAIEQFAGPLPRDLAIFLLTCNGLRIHVATEGKGEEWRLWHTQEMAASILNPHGLNIPPFLVPFRGDPTATLDCLVSGHGPAEGVAVRWDPGSQEVEPLTSSFGRYLERWTQYMIERFGRPAESDPRIACPAFDADYLGRNDPQLAALKKEERVVDWLHQLDHIAASGDDFE